MRIREAELLAEYVLSPRDLDERVAVTVFAVPRGEWQEAREPKQAEDDLGGFELHRRGRLEEPARAIRALLTEPVRVSAWEDLVIRVLAGPGSSPGWVLASGSWITAEISKTSWPAAGRGSARRRLGCSPTAPLRRVQGLRREEVAMLAGLSVGRCGRAPG